MKSRILIIMMIVISGILSVLDAESISGVVARFGIREAFADVELHISATDSVFNTRTDENGNYQFINLGAEDYILAVYVDGHPDYYYNNAYNYNDAELITLGENDNLTINVDLGRFPIYNYEVSGIVLDAITGEALSGQDVTFVKKTSYTHYYHIFTNDSGKFQAPIDYGEYMVYVEGFNSVMNPDSGITVYETQYYDHKRFPEQADMLIVDSDQYNINFDLIPYEEEVRTSSISGNVSPVENRGWFQVEVYNSDVVFINCIPEPIAVAMTDIEGNYEVNLGIGSYILLANDIEEIYLPEFYNNVQTAEEATILEIPNDSTFITGIDFDLQTVIPQGYSKVSGHVTANLGDPISRAEVFLEPDEANYTIVMPYHTVTDENGFYNIEEIASGNYKLSIQAEGFNEYFYDNAVSWESADIIPFFENTNLTIDIDLSPYELDYYQVSGTVKDSETGEPIAGAIVARDYISHNSGVGYIEDGVAITDENGEWMIETYSGVHIFHSFAYTDSYYLLQFYDHEVSPIHAERVIVNSNIDNINFDLMKYDLSNTHSISGNITDENGDIPVFGVSMIAISSDEDWESSAIMENDGSYCLDNLPNDNYYILALSTEAAPTYYRRYIDWNKATLVPVGSTDIDISLLPIESIGFYNLTGNVTDDAYQPIANTMIYAVDPFGTVKGYTQTDEFGYYHIENLTSSNYDLLATKVRYSSDNQEKIISGNDTQDFIIKGTSSIDNGQLTIANCQLEQNYPNPFNPTTTINFSIRNDDIVKLNVYNANGQMVGELINNQLVKGHHSVNFNAENLNSGIYFYTLEANGMKLKNKMLLIK